MSQSASIRTCPFRPLVVALIFPRLALIVLIRPGWPLLGHVCGPARPSNVAIQVITVDRAASLTVRRTMSHCHHLPSLVSRPESLQACVHAIFALRSQGTHGDRPLHANTFVAGRSGAPQRPWWCPCGVPCLVFVFRPRQHTLCWLCCASAHLATMSDIARMPGG